MMYNKYTTSIKEYLEEHIRKDLLSLRETDLLIKLNNKWSDH